MLDIKFIRENPEIVKNNCQARRVNVDLDKLMELDRTYVSLLQAAEKTRAERNQVAEDMRLAENKEELVERGKVLKSDLAKQEDELKAVSQQRTELLMMIPNLTHPDAPIGPDDAHNKELRQWGEIKKLDKPLDHVALGQKLDILDFERGAKVAGAKFYF